MSEHPYLALQLRTRCENYHGEVRTNYCGKCIPCLAADEIERLWAAGDRLEAAAVELTAVMRRIHGHGGNAECIVTADLKAAYREGVKILHPDVPGGSAESFRLLKEAYAYLTGEGS